MTGYANTIHDHDIEIKDKQWQEITGYSMTEYVRT